MKALVKAIHLSQITKFRVILSFAIRSNFELDYSKEFSINQHFETWKFSKTDNLSIEWSIQKTNDMMKCSIVSFESHWNIDPHPKYTGTREPASLPYVGPIGNLCRVFAVNAPFD